ncbi:MAG: hypothetical protein ABIR96_05810 [Bdellovibrionota bacterium]
MSRVSQTFQAAFKKGLSGFALKRSDPTALLLFRLEPHEFYSLPALSESNAILRATSVVGYLLPSLMFVAVVLLLENLLPLSFLFSDLFVRGISLSQAVLLGAILFEVFRLFRDSLKLGLRYVAVSSALAITLHVSGWPNASVLAACGVYAALHALVETHARSRRQEKDRLKLDPLVMLTVLGLVSLGAWGTPWASLGLLGDVWSDNGLSGQLARSCLWAALGPSMLPVLLLHLSYAIAALPGLLMMTCGLGLIFFVVGNTSREAWPRQEVSPRPWVQAAFHGGFVPALALVTIAALMTWPENIQWEQLYFWVMLLGFALRARGWNIKIIVSLAWVVLFTQAIIESLGS